MSARDAAVAGEADAAPLTVVPTAGVVAAQGQGYKIGEAFYQSTPNTAINVGAVHPPELAQEHADLRIRPHELEGDMLRSFVPRAPELDQESDQRLNTLAKVAAECATVHAAAG